MRFDEFYGSPARAGLIAPGKPSSFTPETLRGRLVAQVGELHGAGLTVTARAVLNRYWPGGMGLERIAAELESAADAGAIVRTTAADFRGAPITAYVPAGA